MIFARPSSSAAGVITVEKGSEDAYNYNGEQKGPQVPTGVATVYGPGPNYLDLYHNRGYLVSDEYAIVEERSGRSATRGCIRPTPTARSRIPRHPVRPPTSSVPTRSSTSNRKLFRPRFVEARATSSPSSAASGCSVRWIRPRRTSIHVSRSCIARTAADAFRRTGGKSYSEPDPSLLAFTPPIYGAPSSIRTAPQPPPAPARSPRSPASLTPTSNRKRPTILEAAYGHRFNVTTNFQADVYQSWESQALLGGLEPTRGIPQYVVPSLELKSRSISRGLRNVPRAQSDDQKLARFFDDLQRRGGPLSRYLLSANTSVSYATSRSTRRTTFSRHHIWASRKTSSKRIQT